MWIEPPQTIPAELMELYMGVLVLEYSNQYVRRRYPWEVKIYDDYPPGGTYAQRANRARFQNCVRCFNAQPYGGGEEPDGKGGYSRTWWYEQAGDMWYYNYFIQQSMNIYLDNQIPNWCRQDILRDAYVDSFFPDDNFKSYPRFRIAKWGDPEREWRTYIDPGLTDFYGIAILAKTIFCGPGANCGWPLKVYDVVEPWIDWQIKWNNQPALGNLLSQQSIYPAAMPGWHFITFKPCTYGFCIVSAFNYPVGVEFYSVRSWGTAQDPYLTA